MKRSTLTRRTPLKRTGITRRLSPRKRAFDRALEKVRPLIHARSGGICEAAAPGCTLWAQHIHHVAGRRRKDANDPFFLLDVCWGCHEWIHRHPALAYQEGLLLRSTT